MTENRFECYGLIFLDGFIKDTLTNENIVEPIKLIFLMNELHDENIELHIQNDFLKYENQHMSYLVNENEELKQELFESEVDYYAEIYYDNPIRADDKINSLKREFKERFGKEFKYD